MLLELKRLLYTRPGISLFMYISACAASFKLFSMLNFNKQIQLIRQVQDQLVSILNKDLSLPNESNS